MVVFSHQWAFYVLIIKGVKIAKSQKKYYLI